MNMLIRTVHVCNMYQYTCFHARNFHVKCQAAGDSKLDRMQFKGRLE